jgi:hypothetical protein
MPTHTEHGLVGDESAMGFQGMAFPIASLGKDDKIWMDFAGFY